MSGAHDRLESEADMQKAILLLQLAKQQLEALTPPAPPHAGSMLDVEAKHTAYEPIDTVVVQHRARAVENLERAFDLMFDMQNARVLAYPFSIYSLIRAAIESAATAFWVLESDRKANRVLRSLQLTYRDTTDRRKFIELVAPAGEVAAERSRYERILARLTELKNTVGVLKQKPLGNPPKYTRILEVVSERNIRDGVAGYSFASPLVIWKISSAFIHGSNQLVQALSDFRQVTEFKNGIATVEVTPNMQMLAGSIRVTVDLIARGDRRFAHLATHDYAGRPVD